MTDSNGSMMDNILSVDSGYVSSDSADTIIINTEDSSQIVNDIDKIKPERIASRFVF